MEESEESDENCYKGNKIFIRLIVRDPLKQEK